MFIATKKLLWYEHVIRNTNLMSKLIFQATVNGTRRRGKYCEEIIRAPTTQR